MVGGKNTRFRRDALESLDLDVDANAIDEKHDAANSGPIEGIGISRDCGINKQRWPYEEDVERNCDADKRSAKHRMSKLSRIKSNSSRPFSEQQLPERWCREVILREYAFGGQWHERIQRLENAFREFR